MCNAVTHDYTRFYPRMVYPLISTIKNSFIISELACKWFAQVYMTQVSGQYVL